MDERQIVGGKGLSSVWIDLFVDCIGICSPADLWSLTKIYGGSASSIEISDVVISETSVFIERRIVEVWAIPDSILDATITTRDRSC